MRRRTRPLNAPEARALEAIVARLIPSDANGPGAREAGAAHYIDRALGGALAASRAATRPASRRSTLCTLVARQGLRRVAADRSGLGAHRCRDNIATGFAELGDLLRARAGHTLQGTFGDPYYGGNANFVGWDLIGYPGRPHDGDGRASSSMSDAADAESQVGVRLRDVQQGDAHDAGDDHGD